MNKTLSKMLVVGGANIDMTGSCVSRLIPGDSNPGIVKSSAGGVGRNISESLGRLGFGVNLVSAVGDDFGKKHIIESCVNAGVDTQHLIEYSEFSTGTYLAINNQLGALLAAIADMAIIDQLTPEVMATKQAVFDAHEHVVVEANLPRRTLEWIAALPSSQKLYVDAVSATKAPKLATILSSIDILKVNRDEAAAILNTQGEDIALAKALHEQGVKTVLLSQGPQGAIVFNQNGGVHKAAIKGLNASDTGAGDALFSGFIAAQQLVREVPFQLEFAIACATFTLNSRQSVNPGLSLSTIRELYLSHWSSNAWQ